MKIVEVGGISTN